jgi:hypothetical protein
MIKRTNNELQNTTLKTKDGATRTQLKTGGELMCSERVNSSCSTPHLVRSLSKYWEPNNFKILKHLGASKPKGVNNTTINRLRTKWGLFEECVGCNYLNNYVFFNKLKYEIIQWTMMMSRGIVYNHKPANVKFYDHYHNCVRLS